MSTGGSASSQKAQNCFRKEPPRESCVYQNADHLLENIIEIAIMRSRYYSFFDVKLNLHTSYRVVDYSELSYIL